MRTREEIVELLKKSENSYLERYSDQIMQQMKKHSKSMQINNIRIKPSKKIDLKTKMILQYAHPEKGRQYKDLDAHKIQLERKIKGMPYSGEAMTLDCKQDISKCQNFN